MNLTIEANGGIHVFRVAGEVDLKSSPQLREKLQAVLKEKPKGIILEMSGCNYIDSSGIATLVETLQRLKKDGGKMAIAGAVQRVKDIFEIAHLDGIFPMFASQDEALESLK